MSKSQAQLTVNTSPCTHKGGIAGFAKITTVGGGEWTLHSRRNDVLCYVDSAVHKRGADRGGAAASTWICQTDAAVSGARPDAHRPVSSSREP